MHSSFYKIDENVSSRMSQLFRRWLSDGLLASQFSFFQGFSFLPARLEQSNNFTGTSLLGLIITKVKASIGTKFSSKLFAMPSSIIAKIELSCSICRIFVDTIKGENAQGDLIARVRNNKFLYCFGGNDTLYGDHGIYKIISVSAHAFQTQCRLISGGNDAFGKGVGAL